LPFLSDWFSFFDTFSDIRHRCHYYLPLPLALILIFSFFHFHWLFSRHFRFYAIIEYYWHYFSLTPLLLIRWFIAITLIDTLIIYFHYCAISWLMIFIHIDYYWYYWYCHYYYWYWYFHIIFIFFISY
jgi:hypothetical protein